MWCNHPRVCWLSCREQWRIGDCCKSTWLLLCTWHLCFVAALPLFLPVLLKQAVFCDHLKSKINEPTCSMQGKSQHKTYCRKFKSIEYRIQTVNIADDGYTWDFFFQNKPIKKKWTDKRLSSIYAWLIHLFKNCKDLHHSMIIDNPFNSVNILLLLQIAKQKSSPNACAKRLVALLCVWCNRRWRGNQPIKQRHTVKAAVLMVDLLGSDVIVASVFDQRPFYMISNVAKEVTWVKVGKVLVTAVIKIFCSNFCVSVLLLGWKTGIMPWSVIMVHALLWFSIVSLAVSMRLVYKYVNYVLN